MMINKRLINVVPESKKHIVKNVLFQWISLLSNVVIIFIIGKFLEKLIRDKSSIRIEFIIVFAISTSICLGLRYYFTYKSSEESYLASKSVKKKLRQMIYEKIISMGASYNKNFTTSELLQVSVEGVEQLEVYFGSYLPQFFYSMLAPLTLFIIFLFLHFSVAIVLLVCVPLIPVSIVFVQKFAKKILAKYWGQYTKLGDSFLENLQGLTTLKIYKSDKYKHEMMNKEAENFRIVTMKVLTMQLNSITIMDLVAYGGGAIGIIMGINLFRAGTIGIMGVFAIIILSAEFFLPLRLLGSYFHIAMNGMAASEKMFSLLDTEVSDSRDKILGDVDIDIEIRDLSYSYGEKKILSGINMSIPKNTFVSIVGESGSGKSTIAKILMGINEDYQGEIKFTDIELKEIYKRDIMKNLVLIGTQSYVFKGTFRENLCMANPNASDKELWEILDKLKLSQFLKSENGLSTEIMEMGSNLSGGQKQRLAIARALLLDSKVYIFDEATSNIDVESEEIIMSLLHELAKTKTIILISHRLANVVKSSKIYVLESGKIVEEGSHKKLIDNNGIYCNLWNTQKELEEYLGGCV